MTTIRDIGIGAVGAAARLCQAVRVTLVDGAGPATLDKADRSPVTVADFGAQALVCRTIDTAFPYDPIVAEEDSSALRTMSGHALLAAVTSFVRSEVAQAGEDGVCAWIDRGQGNPGERFWVLDPIDGTKGFLRNDQYAVALALIEQGEVSFGFLACPGLPHPAGTGAIFVAERGKGAELLTLDGTSLGPVRVSTVAEPPRARLAESVEAAHTNQGLAGTLRAVLGMTEPPLRMDSQAKYGAVAMGAAEVYLRSPNVRTPQYREHIWDHAAGYLIVTEAGGTVSDVYGQPLDWRQGRRLEQNVGVLATNGNVHGAVLEVLAPLLPPR